MSLKNKDEHNRWRNKTVAFRVSPEEWEQIECYVQLSGLTKQDYITRRLVNKEVVVQGNPRVYKALRNNLADVLTELQRIENGGSVNDELLDLIKMIADILGGLKEVSNMKLVDLRPAERATQTGRRRGRGPGSGLGKTSGKGHKGQNARSR